MVSLLPPGMLPWGHLQGTQKKFNHLGQMETLPAIWTVTRRGGGAGRRVLWEWQELSWKQRRMRSLLESEENGNSLEATLDIVLCNQLFISEL